MTAATTAAAAHTTVMSLVIPLLLSVVGHHRQAAPHLQTWLRSGLLKLTSSHEESGLGCHTDPIPHSALPGGVSILTFIFIYYIYHIEFLGPSIIEI